MSPAPISRPRPPSAHRQENTFLGHPPQLAPSFFTEMWERFSFYGIRPLLVLFMSAAVSDGGFGFTRENAAAIVGIYAGSVYLAALPGGWLADRWLGQERAVWYGSLLIALGHLCIALSAVFSKPAFFAGLLLIVLGSGLFKTCLSVMVGRLYRDDDPRRDGGFSLFYVGINLGALFAPLITGILQREYGWHWGFGAGGLGMLVSLLIFRLRVMPAFAQLQTPPATPPAAAHAPAAAGKRIALGIALLLGGIAMLAGFGPAINPVKVAEWMGAVIAVSVGLYFVFLFAFGRLSTRERKQVLACSVLFAFAAIFFAAFEQQPTALNLFAQDYTDRMLLGWEIPSVWFQSVNPLFIILIAPLFGELWVRLARRGHNPSGPAKFVIALLLCGLGFIVMMFAAREVLAGTQRVSMLWLIACLLLHTLGELCLSPVGLAAITRLAPARLGGQMMGVWFLSSALGNVLAGLAGGRVHADRVTEMPTLFGATALILFGSALVLALLVRPLRRMLASERAAAPADAARDLTGA